MHLVQYLASQFGLTPLGHGECGKLDFSLMQIGPAHDLQLAVFARVVIDRIVSQVLVEEKARDLGTGVQLRQMGGQLTAPQRGTDRRIDFQFVNILQQQVLGIGHAACNSTPPERLRGVSPDQNDDEAAA